MAPAAAGLLIAAAIVVALGCLGAWFALRRPARRLQQRRREQALAAADHYTPAQRPSPYGATPRAPAATDPCDPGLSDAERVEAMRRLLLQRPAETAQTLPLALSESDGPQTTSPMAWTPTLPPDEADAVEARRPGSRPRVRDADHEHVTI